MNRICQSNLRHALRLGIQACVVSIFVALGAGHAQAMDVLAHFEYECGTDEGCFNSANMGTQVQFEIEIFPDEADFGTYDSGDTADITVPAPDFIVDFLTSGSLAEPEPMAFGTNLLGAGGGGQLMTKMFWLDGVMVDTPAIRQDAGYDVPPLNGVDLAGYEITDVRFQLLSLEIFDSSSLDGSAVRQHVRYEFLGQVPEPATMSLLVPLALLAVMRRKR